MSNATNAPATAIDTPALLAELAAQQQRIVAIVADLDDATMRRPILPSGWSCGGMIQHLTGMTNFWFQAIMSGSELVAEEDDGFALADDVSLAELVAQYSLATASGHDLVRQLPLDAPPAWWPDDLFGPWRLHSLFEVLQHVLVETATHAGHLDTTRELIDGRTWSYELGRLADPV
jgi:uncharacterized damage-inducible protein DinB